MPPLSKSRPLRSMPPTRAERLAMSTA
ncbi:hypothetical protein CH63R_07727 [Colletotrichum higginsianum IMI 349063]|uniref:Uncharacterized protein n=1 Tax=Colletotrichum higginsianum (strain IMI 349063) TaxID=759273 RepID=A0A1B7YA74_COLHI|nr:hypothetical protein CH63R_07727 [Colletotrichum higginsianum IMI 349063]OBR08962.1 hypothetical protein CH63R_07727 [Colletotrichum higginsianum IMI 349063]